MLRLSLVEFLFRGIPEAFFIIMIAYIFSNKKVSKMRVIISTFTVAILAYSVRLLPISFGVNTIINMMVFIVIGVYIMRISVNASIFSIFVSVILLSFCEWVNTVVLNSIFKINVLSNSYLRLIYNLPSLIMFMIIVLIFYKFRYKINRRFKDVFY